MKPRQATEEIKKEQEEPSEDVCFYCGGQKVRGNGFGADRKCPKGCGPSSVISSFN